MKKTLLALLSLTLLLAACSKEENAPQPDNIDHTSMRFYGVKMPEQPGKQGAAQHDRLWHNGTTIKVRFLNGSEVLKERVRTVAKEWEEYANITFKFVESGDAHVRVGFDWNDNRYITWSYIGTDCKTVLDQGEATLSFAYFEYIIDTDPETVRADILRAFGQVLGLELESRNINFSPKWTPNPALVPNYWSFNISDVMWAQLKKYVFDPLDAENAVSTEAYDKLSIMKWPFPSNILLNGGGASMNFELSETDKAFIAQLYPKPEDEAIIIMETSWPWVYFSINSITMANITRYAPYLCSFKVDWGDGTIENNPQWANHTYTTSGPHVIKIYAHADSLLMFECADKKLIKLDVTKATNLIELECSANNLTELDLSKNIELKRLDCVGNNFVKLDLSQNKKLNSLNCSYNCLDVLDITNNLLIDTLTCTSMSLDHLDLTKNKKLRVLSCGDNLFNTINISQNTSLTELWCMNNKLTSLDLSQNIALYHLNIRNNQLTQLNIDNNKELAILNCSSNNLSHLNIQNNTKLTYLDCELNSISQLDFHQNSLLEWLTLSSNQFEEIDLSYNTNLKGISCDNNPIISNQVAMISFANSLTDWTSRNTQWWGCYVRNETAKNWIVDICTAKKWSVW